jgi:hypothetical protein
MTIADVRHDKALVVLDEGLELDLPVIEAEEQAGRGIVRHPRDAHVAEIELVDLLRRLARADADQRRAL